MTGAVLFVLFAAEGLTVLFGVGGHLPTHVLIGVMLIPPVTLKVVSTLVRFTRYYLGAPDVVAKGPPPIVLRVAGPFVVVTTVAVLVSGVALVVAGRGAHLLDLAHKASFVLWFVAMTVHVLGHAQETPVLAGADWWRGRASGRRVPGATRDDGVGTTPGRVRRLLLVSGACALGALAGWISLAWIGPSWNLHT
jgi:hypothetical protein